MDFNIILEFDKPIMIKARGDLRDSEMKCAIKKGSFFNTTWDVVLFTICVCFLFRIKYLVYQGYH